MLTEPDFIISATGPVSAAFRKRNATTFQEAMKLVRYLPYGRNADKSNLLSVLQDNCGTCSSKHALLAELSQENGLVGVKLMIGMFRMNARNTPAVATVLQQYNLSFVPEAHCYLSYNHNRIDCTRPESRPEDFVSELLQETEIRPDQIGDFKVTLHKQYLADWLRANPQLGLSAEALWEVRELCIQALAANSKPR